MGTLVWMPVFLVVLAAAGVAGFWFVGERGRFLISTWTFLRQDGRGWHALHGYVYLRWIVPYIKTLLRLPDLRTSRPAAWATGWLAQRYHGKVLTLEHAREIITLDRRIPLTDLEQIVPYPVARKIVLDGPPEGVAFECVCRHARPTIAVRPRSAWRSANLLPTSSWSIIPTKRAG